MSTTATPSQRVYGCCRCQHSLTREQAYLGRQHSGMDGYFCEEDAPAGAKPVVPEPRVRSSR